MWTVYVTQNTLSVSKECFEEIFEIIGGNYLLGYNPIGMKFVLDYDAMEHIDFLARFPGITDIITKHNGNGVLTFGSLEGDNAGSFWGYKFTPGEKMTKLTGKIVYTEHD